jgi:FixJ family two-component response regulator
MTAEKVQAQGQPTVFVIDDDPAIRQGLSSLLRSVNIHAEIVRLAQGIHAGKTS